MNSEMSLLLEILEESNTTKPLTGADLIILINKAFERGEEEENRIDREVDPNW